MKQQNHILKYGVAAEDSNDGWEKYSLPIGNGYLGANIFGRTDAERIQFATNTFANDKSRGGVCLSWKGTGKCYAVYRAVGNDSGSFCES